MFFNTRFAKHFSINNELLINKNKSTARILPTIDLLILNVTILVSVKFFEMNSFVFLVFG
jgi:hypothetical protein